MTRLYVQDSALIPAEPDSVMADAPTAPLAATVSTSDFRLFTSDGLAAAAGGNGTVLGTAGFQKITIANQPGSIVLDPSFNQGGDTIVLSGKASAYMASLSGSSAVLSDGDTMITIPIGSVGTQIDFDDGERTLAVIGATAKIGSQAITAQAAAITAPADNAPPLSGENPAAMGRVFLASGASASIGGDNMIFGTTGAEKLTYLGGNIVLDPSFNRGGDTLIMPDTRSAYSGYLSGSSVIIQSSTGQISVPLGSAGILLNFAGEQLTLSDQAGTPMLGTLSLAGSSAAHPVALDPSGGFTGTTLSLDIGSGSTVETVNLQSNVSYQLTDDANKNTDVLVKGFGADDVIKVANAASGDYNFSTGDADHDGRADDLLITYVTGSTINVISLTDVVSPTALVMNLATAEAAVGHNFISFSGDPASTPATPSGGGSAPGTGSTGTTGTAGGTGSATGGSPVPAALDVGDGATVVQVNLAAGTSYLLSDDANKNTNVVVNGFTNDDLIRVTGATGSDYNFATGNDPKDLHIAYVSQGAINVITLNDVLTNDHLIYNLATAEAAMGYNFITFA